MASDSGADGPPLALIITALIITVAAIATVFAFATSSPRTPSAPVVIGAVPAPQAESAECGALLNALPDQLGDYSRATTADPTPRGAAAWRADGEPVVLRCGIGRPAEFVVGSPIQVVDDVQWFRIDDRPGDHPDDRMGLSTWLCVDRPVYIALTLPGGSGPAPIQALSGAIDRSMPAVAIRPAPAR